MARETCDRCGGSYPSSRMVTIVNRFGDVVDLCPACDHDSRRNRT